MMLNTKVKILRDFNVEIDHVMVYRRPHIVVIEKQKNALLIDSLILAFLMI